MSVSWLIDLKNYALFYISVALTIGLVSHVTTGRWCNATWDTILCWPATPAGKNVTLKCPPMKGLNPNSPVSKHCNSDGTWFGRVSNDSSMDSGYTDYSIFDVTKTCHASGYWDIKPDNPLQTLGDPGRPHGWTDYTGCFVPDMFDMVTKLGDEENIKKAQKIARIARYVEFIGLSLSFLALVISLTIFCCIARLRVFRTQLHIQLKIALLLITTIRLILYIDGAFSQRLGHLQITDIGLTINSSKYICEAFYIMLEYAKTVAASWAIIEGFYLHSCLVLNVFGTEPKLLGFCLFGWGVPVIHVAIWFLAIYFKQGASGVERCLGPYYLNPQIWILDGVRLFELALHKNTESTFYSSVTVSETISLSGYARQLSFIFLLNIVRVLWVKIRGSSGVSSADNSYQKSIKAALMLMPLLGIPNILQLIPLYPTKTNITLFAIYTYVATFFYMYQGFLVALIYCFTNREVIEALRTSYDRYRMLHSGGFNSSVIRPNTLVTGTSRASMAMSSKRNRLFGPNKRTMEALSQKGSACSGSCQNSLLEIDLDRGKGPPQETNTSDTGVIFGNTNADMPNGAQRNSLFRINSGTRPSVSNQNPINGRRKKNSLRSELLSKLTGTLFSSSPVVKMSSVTAVRASNGECIEIPSQTLVTNELTISQPDPRADDFIPTEHTIYESLISENEPDVIKQVTCYKDASPKAVAHFRKSHKHSFDSSVGSKNGAQTITYSATTNGIELKCRCDDNNDSDNNFCVPTHPGATTQNWHGPDVNSHLDPSKNVQKHGINGTTLSCRVPPEQTRTRERIADTYRSNNLARFDSDSFEVSEGIIPTVNIDLPVASYNAEASNGIPSPPPYELVTRISN